jgi:hypothetical protein
VGNHLEGTFQHETDKPITRAERDQLFHDAVKRDSSSMYAQGFSYGMRLPTSIVERHIWRGGEAELKARIAANEFDVAIASLRGHQPDYFHELKQAKVKFAFVEWNDIPGGYNDLTQDVFNMCQHGPVFLREMSDNTC